MILGIEHVSCESMQPLLSAAVDHPARGRAQQLQQKCILAGADGLVFINGFSERSSDEFLLDLADDVDAETLCIAGVDIEHAEVFGDPEEMRAVREAVPYAARTQACDGRLVYKNHSDANIRLPADAINPYGVDPHNRVTMSSDDAAAFAGCRSFLVEQRAQYYRELAQLCTSSAAEFIGGEKSADSEIGIYQALSGPEHAPAALYQQFQQQRQCIAAAADLFNWRALPPYR